MSGISMRTEFGELLLKPVAGLQNLADACAHIVRIFEDKRRRDLLG